MKKLFFSLLIIISFSASGQVSGFMGKRFAAGMGVSASPAFFNPTKVERSDVYINQRYFVNFNYILSRKWIFDASYHRYSTAVQFENFDKLVEEVFNGRGQYTYQLNGGAIALGFTRFLTKNNDFIAPVGRYFSFGYMKCFYTLTDTKGNVFKPGTKMAEGSVQGITLAFGRKRVFFKQILFDMAIEGALLLDFNQENDEELNKTSASRVFSGNLINIKLGAGYLF